MQVDWFSKGKPGGKPFGKYCGKGGKQQLGGKNNWNNWQGGKGGKQFGGKGDGKGKGKQQQEGGKKCGFD